MSLRDILVPQMGEGLREVLIHKLLKKPGEFVRRDEAIYVMESDKAVIEVESPYEGTLREWLVEEANILAVGAPVARIDTASVATADDSSRRESEPSAGTAGRGDGVATPDSTRPPANPPARAAVFVPPRTRAYCKALAIDACRYRQLLDAEVGDFGRAGAASAHRRRGRSRLSGLSTTRAPARIGFPAGSQRTIRGAGDDEAAAALAATEASRQSFAKGKSGAPGF
jgi:pyruvate/2-oxoglutarate dehydrogenase complex dihydrolipoamide acyltransferase (E2) component